MTEQDRYDVVFSGELARGAEIVQTQANVAKLFKLTEAKVQALFSGKRIVLKRNLSFDQASEYRVAIKKAGALVDLSVSAPQANADVSNAKPIPPDLSDSSQASAAPGSSVLSARDALTISAPGADVLAPDERQQWHEKQVDTAHLSVKEMGSDLLDSSEKRVVEARDVSVDGLDLAEPGEDVLRPDERRQWEEKQIDTSALSLAEPGARLPEGKREAGSMPDTSHLSLHD